MARKESKSKSKNARKPVDQVKTGKPAGEIWENLNAAPEEGSPPQAEPPENVSVPISKSIPPQPEVSATRGRPTELADQWTKATVVLLNKQIGWLDQLAVNVRNNTGAAVSRAEIIRAAITILEQSELDFSGIHSEEELVDFFFQKFGKKD